MARKEPLAVREKQICRRVRELREKSLLSRVAFAKLIEIDSTLLASYEHERNPLKYEVGRRIVEKFGVNPEWLAIGSGDMIATVPTFIPNLELLGASGNPSFSDIYDKYLAKSYGHLTVEDDDLLEVTGNDISPLEKRVQCHRVLSELLTQWLAAVPDESIHDFSEAILSTKADFFEGIANDPPPLVNERLKQLRNRQRSIPHTGFSDLLKQNSPIENESKVKESKLPIDLEIPRSNIASVSDKTVSLWEQLRARLISLLEERGSRNALAQHLNVTRQAVREWIVGNCSPSAETTLRLLLWVDQHEGQQKSPGSGVTQPELKTREENSNDYSQSSPKK